jgi:anti-sigma B factor antagonist
MWTLPFVARAWAASEKRRGATFRNCGGCSTGCAAALARRVDIDRRAAYENSIRIAPLVTVVQNNFQIDTRRDGTAAVITVTGELDLASSPALRDELERAGQNGVELVILDLRELVFMDSTGLSVVVRAHQHAVEAGHRFAVVRGGKQVERLLMLTGVGERLTVIDDPEELLDMGSAGVDR